MRLASPSADRILEKRRQDWEKTHPILLGQERSLARLFRHYVQGGGSQADHVLKALQAKMDEVAAQQGFTQSEESIFDQYGRILPECLRQVCPEYIDAYFDVGPQDCVETHELLAAGRNEHHDESLPLPLNMVLHRKLRPALNVYGTTKAALFVSPTAYQLCNIEENWFWPSASSRTLSKLATSAPTLPVADNLVIIQDRYPAENFAHFLFDWIPRLGLFVESRLQPVKDCCFVMGGIPDKFRTLLLQALSATYGIEPGQFFFPEDALILRTEGKIYWFSDQVETYMHPAQMAHTRSIEVIRRISGAIEIAASPFKRIYISRGDTGRRRVANEHGLWQQLASYDFEMIRLADHSVERQISLFRGAEHIVAPHGMGLTHLAFHLGQPRVLELFNPQRGGDDYALISKAMGYGYQFIVGQPADNGFDDFSISTDSVRAVLERFDLQPVASAEASGLSNLIPCSASFESKWHPGWQTERSHLSDDVPRLLAENSVIRHVRSDPDKQPDSNAGAWSDIPVDSSRIFTASCWIWVPEKFVGKQIAISLGEWGHQDRIVADLSKRDTWQRIRATATAPPDRERCHIVLRIDGHSGAAAYSTCWQLVLGPEPGEYTATR